MEQKCLPYLWFMCWDVYCKLDELFTMEVLGLALPYNGTALAVSDQRREIIRQAAFKLVENIKMI